MRFFFFMAALIGFINHVSAQNVFPTANGTSVGIGTITPAEQLEVTNPTTGAIRISSQKSQILANDVIGRLDFYKPDASTGGAGVATSIRSRSYDLGGAFDMDFVTGSVATPITTMTLHWNGNVGIGNTNPSSALHVGSGSALAFYNGAGTASAPQIVNLQTSGVAMIGTGVNDGTNNYRINMFADNTNALTGVAVVGSSGNPGFVIRNTSTEYMRILGNGNVGIGTTAPVSKLDINGAISIKGVNVNDAQSIAVATDGTYVVASGARVKGTYMLTFEAANRVQTVVVLANANQFDDNSSLSVLSNTSYNNAAVMSNFRLVFSSDKSVVYLVFDIANRNGGASISAYFNGTGFYNANWGGMLPGSPVAGGIYPWAVNMGNVGIGTTAPDAKLAVNGTIHTKEVRVDLTGWSDYVFNKEYVLPTLMEVKNYIDKNHHLPDMPSEKEVLANGVNLGEMNKVLTKKVEELTLYLIAKDDQLNAQQKDISELKRQLKRLMEKETNKRSN